jgi:hypothetical protein
MSGYTPYYSGGWQSGESGGTPITPAALNNMESGIGAALTSADVVNTLTNNDPSKVAGQQEVYSINQRFVNYTDVTATTSSTGSIPLFDASPSIPATALLLYAWCIAGGDYLVILVRSQSSSWYAKVLNWDMTPVSNTAVTLRIVGTL